MVLKAEVSAILATLEANQGTLEAVTRGASRGCDSNSRWSLCSTSQLAAVIMIEERQRTIVARRRLVRSPALCGSVIEFGQGRKHGRRWLRRRRALLSPIAFRHDCAEDMGTGPGSCSWRMVHAHPSSMAHHEYMSSLVPKDRLRLTAPTLGLM